MVTKYHTGDVAPVKAPIETTTPVNLGDLVGISAGAITGLTSGAAITAGNSYGAPDQPLDASPSTNDGMVAAFVLNFLGVSGQMKGTTAGVYVAGTPAAIPVTADQAKRPYSQGEDNTLRVDTGGVQEFDCSSATYTVGQLVGPVTTGTTTSRRLSNTLAGVADEAHAIGRVVEGGTSLTRLKVRLLSVKSPLARQS